MYYVDVLELSHDLIMFLVIHVGYAVVPEVSHDRTMVLQTHLYYVNVPEVFHEGIMLRVIHVLRWRPQAFSRLKHVFRKSTCIKSSPTRFFTTELCF